jgi:hypothetical protein
MENNLLNDESLKLFIGSLGISQENKDTLVSGLPYMDLEKRKKLLDVLKEICFLDIEEKEVVDRVKNFCSQ